MNGVKGMNSQYQGRSGKGPYSAETAKKAGTFHGKKLAPLPQTKNDCGKGKKSAYQTAPPSPRLGLSGELGKLFGKLGSLSLETEDLLLMAVLYLMYRESGDKELLIMIGALLFIQ